MIEHRRSSVMASNSHTSVIQSTASLCSVEERRNSSRLGSSVLPLSPLIHLSEDEESDKLHRTASKSTGCTVVRIVNPSSTLSEDDPTVGNKPNPDSSGYGTTTATLCCGRGQRPSTWFHFYLCFGMLGFLVFWLVLMLRIYLPESYWTWSYIWWSGLVSNSSTIYIPNNVQQMSRQISTRI